MKAMSFRVGMTWWGAARWLTATALCCLGLVDVGPQAQEVPLVWDAEWTVIQPEDSASQMEAKAWEAMLESALVLQPPQRILGVPFQHIGSRITGRWKKAHDAGMSVPRGAASAWDRAAMEQSRLLFESRMLRAGYLDGRARFDTVSQGNKVHLGITLDPGRRIRCGHTAVEGGGAGLSNSDIRRLEQEWSRWEGEWLDLDQLDRARAEGAHKLQLEGWYGFLRDHLVLEYEIPKYEGDLGAPNLFVPLTSDQAQRKIDALLEHYGSQRDKGWFDAETFRGLMRLRGVECNSPSGYAEAFHAPKITL